MKRVTRLLDLFGSAVLFHSHPIVMAGNLRTILMLADCQRVKHDVCIGRSSGAELD